MFEPRMGRPDARQGHKLYDSTVDDTRRDGEPGIFVTYHDAQACTPEGRANTRPYVRPGVRMADGSLGHRSRVPRAFSEEGEHPSPEYE